jgi:hypothetical protein
MLQTLLWSCPVCKSEDSIIHKERTFGKDRIVCNACQSSWDLIRNVGGLDYNLRLLSGKNGSWEKPLAEWYDQMMSNFTLRPQVHPNWPLNHGTRPLPGESLYLYGDVLKGFASQEDPIFEQPDFNEPNDEIGPVGMKYVGSGQLFFTSHRLVFKVANSHIISNSWVNLHSVDTLMDRFFDVTFGMQSYAFVIDGQSVLKWLAYTRSLINKNSLVKGNRIYQGYI